MSTKNYFFGVIVTALVASLAVFILIAFHQETPTASLAGSAAGTTNTTAKIAQYSVSVSTSTVFTMNNGDATDRIISDANVFLSGGVSTSSDYVIQCATSTVSTGFDHAPQYILNQKILHTSTEPFGTTTGAIGYAMATTSPGLTGTTTPNNLLTGIGVAVNQYSRVWKAGSNLVCQLTNSGNANLLDSSISGYIGFRYWSN